MQLNVTQSKMSKFITQTCTIPNFGGHLGRHLGRHFEDFRRPKFLYTNLFHSLLSYIFQKKPSNLKAKIV